ncbi:MAG: hypothetical protein IKU52_05915, partial [Clostridia bacterium]|nr:hypothetical protein [Clostridia bacterium]
MKNTISCGIDIGTTTLSAVVLNISKGEQLKAFTLEHKSALESELTFEKIQDADKILSLVKELVKDIFENYPDIDSIGFTGQMHGIVYIDEKGRACSPLYTWQDTRGEYVCDEIGGITGYNISSGYGVATHYYNLKNNLVPQNAVTFCSIMDYVAMQFSGRTKPLCHPSVAASFGIYDIEKGGFDFEALLKLGIKSEFLPEIISEESFIGEYNKAKLTSAIGDNQASVFGSVKDEECSALVNYGTGSQVSVITDNISVTSPLELRPYIAGKKLVCGCALCGGYAYQVLEGFFSSYARALGNNGTQYPVMDELAKAAYHNKNKEQLKVAPLFKGTRENPKIRGSVNGLSHDNFNAGNLILATIEGMASELYDMYRISGISDRNILVASGNGVRKNKVLQSVLEEK